MSRTRVGVLRGGTSGEYDLSLKTGAAIFDALPEERYDVKDIFIDKKGYWHVRGMPVDAARALSQMDVVVNGLHGGVGEDGTVQRILERAWVPYTGSRAMPSAHALNKIQARKILAKTGVRMPRAVWFTASSGVDPRELSRIVFAQFSPPYVVKPPADGASLGIRLAATVLELPQALADALSAYGAALVEELILGDEATVGVIEDFRGEELYALPPARVVYPKSSPILHFDHHAEGGARYVVPSDFSHAEKAALADAARAAHRALGLDHFSRADFILTRRGPYLLEVNSLPGLHAHAAMPPMLESVGSSVGDFLDHAIALARTG